MFHLHLHGSLIRRNVRVRGRAGKFSNLEIISFVILH